MIRATIDRVESLPEIADPIIVTNIAHAQATRREMRTAGIPNATIILEPIGRNTAPAIAVAALQAIETHDDPLLVVLPADHMITDEDTFAAAVSTALDVAEDGFLVTFGITPLSPETAYGYIKAGESLTGPGLRIEDFKEKPDAATALRYVESGDYSWNSGMFVFRAAAYLEELERYRPDILAASRKALGGATTRGATIELDAAAFRACPGESVDTAVMEATTLGAVLPIEPGWSDVGSWSSLADVSPQDDDGNSLLGDVVAVDTTNSYVRSADRLVAAIGLDRVVVVDTADAILVASMDATQDVKTVVEQLASDGRSEADTNGDVVTDWGVKKFQTAGPGHAVSILEIDAGHEIATHEHTDQHIHWQVMSGSGVIVVDGDSSAARPGLSLYVASSTSHSAENTGKEPLRVVQIAVDTDLDSQQLSRFSSRKGIEP
jgi:mannose-1-phosphate guanylyltransferase